MTTEPTIPPEIAPRTGDLALIQALAETRLTARRRAEEEGEAGDGRWRSIADHADRVLAAVGVAAPGAGHPPAIGFDRLDRAALGLDAAGADRIAATLLALQDRPSGERLDTVDRTLADLADEIG